MTEGAFSLSGSTLGLTLNNGTGNISVPSVDLSSATSSGKKLVTSGDITDFVTASVTDSSTIVGVDILKEFDIEYISVQGTTYETARTTISPGSYTTYMGPSSSISLGPISYEGEDSVTIIQIVYDEIQSIRMYIFGRMSDSPQIVHSKDVSYDSHSGYRYRLYA